MSINQIVYVLSTNFSGSHFLALQLASHSKCISIGELHRFKRDIARYKQACHICKTDDDCPVFKGLGGLQLNKLHSQLIANISTDHPEVDTLIDNSKKTDWARKFRNLPGIKPKYIHLIRDPRALARRWMVTYVQRSEKNKVRLLMMRRCWPHLWDILSGSEANVYTWKWVHQNRLITDFLTRNGLDYKLITYRGLVFKSDETLTGLMEWIGHGYEPEQKEYWKFVHHGSQKAQYMQPPKNGKKVFDQRWKEFLDKRIQEEIAGHAGVNQYLTSLGLTLEDDGIH